MGYFRKRKSLYQGRKIDLLCTVYGIIICMVELPKDLPDDPEQLKELVRRLAAERIDFLEKVQIIEQRYRELVKGKYGRKNEAFDADQLLLFALREADNIAEDNLAPAEAALGGASEAKKQGHGRRKPDDDMVVKTVVHDVPEAERVCPNCKCAREQFGQTVTRLLDYVPGFAFCWEHIRLKYICRTCPGNALIAPMPAQAIDRGMPAPGMLAYLATSKYADHLPLHRLEGILSRQGLNLNRSTMCDWVAHTARMLQPIYDHMVEKIRNGRVIWTDDTPIKVLDRTLKRRTKTGRIWVYRGDPRHPYIVFHYTPSRKRDGPREFLKNYSGYMQADAFSGYDCIFVGGGVVEVACMAHARRKFLNAFESHQTSAGEILRLIQDLYAIEKSVKDQNAEEKVLARKAALPILESMKTWMLAEKLIVLPKSPLGQAINYALKNWDALEVYVTDGDLTIDNNLAENALRPIAVGRKNWMFAGSDNGGNTAAILASIVATCKRLKLDPFKYFSTAISLLTENPNLKPEDLLPGILNISS
jgi:transposase